MSEAQMNIPLNKKTAPVLVIAILLIGGAIYYHNNKPREVNEHLKEMVIKELQVRYHAALLKYTQNNKNTMSEAEFKQASANSDLTGRVTFPKAVLKKHPTRERVYVLNVDILVDGKPPVFGNPSEKYHVKRHSDTRWEILPY
ncbi:MAG TPA: hypothetical protein DCM28_23100 [Phycisphaerales bacterium]|mgnify:CR=1 FL=1|nr:hypothetical protein [Phycisphaerales bacterium]